MKDDAEQHAQSGTKHRQQYDLDAGDQVKIRNVRQMEHIGADTHMAGYFGCDQGREHTRHQSGVIHHAHTDDLHGKNNGGQSEFRRWRKKRHSYRT